MCLIDNIGKKKEEERNSAQAGRHLLRPAWPGKEWYRCAGDEPGAIHQETAAMGTASEGLSWQVTCPPVANWEEEHPSFESSVLES